MIENVSICEYYLSQGYVLVPPHYFDVVAVIGFFAGCISTLLAIEVRKWMMKRRRS